MKRAYFSRKNLIFLTLFYFYILISLVTGLCIDTGASGEIAANVMKRGNPIQGLSVAMGFPDGYGYGIAQRWILMACLSIYLLLFVTSFCYERRLAIFLNQKPWSKKWVYIYLITFVICSALGFGIGSVSQYPYTEGVTANSYLFSLNCFAVGLIVYIALLSVIGGAILLYVNFKNIDKPFRWFNDRDEENKEEEEKEDEEEKAKEQGSLDEAFGEKQSNGKGGTGSGSGIGGGNTGTTEDGVPTLKGDDVTLPKELVFPGLVAIDNEFSLAESSTFDDDIPLSELASKFRNYLAKEEGLYFEIRTIREFLAGIATSRLIILEGLSGTGKSSIARYFSTFIGEDSFFAPVQTTWRDRTSILGFFNDFSKTYNETEFLKRLYEASYKTRHVNVMVLDEMNISRIEYYFADFLSVMEYPSEKWKLKIMQLPYEFVAPDHLEDGILTIPTNTFFIGTANKDDSTYTITDKVYDRAITINFDVLNELFEVKEDVSKTRLSFDFLEGLFETARNTEEFNLNEEDLERFKILTDFTYETFDLAFGNRIYNQILKFTPVFVGLGGKKDEALDFMFSRKVIAKLEGHYEDYVKKGLENLLSLVRKNYGNGFKETEHVINKLLRKF